MSGSTFHDHFSGHAAAYAAHRPTYPEALFAWIAEQAPGRTMAWDVATSNGQAAVALAAYFDAVHATDASAEQVEQARASTGAISDRIGRRSAASSSAAIAISRCPSRRSRRRLSRCRCDGIDRG
jgi:hypothetical protein